MKMVSVMLIGRIHILFQIVQLLIEKNYDTAWLILWQIEVILEMKRGDSVFFCGSVIAHNIIDIEGERNSVDCFTHKSVFDWWDFITESLTHKHKSNNKEKSSDAIRYFLENRL